MSHIPQGPIFGPQAPQREGLDAQRLRGAHLVERGHGIQKPDVMLQIMLVQVADVRIQTFAVKVHVRFGVAGRQPGILHGHIDVFHARRQRAALRLVHPVVSVIADGGDQLVPGDDLDRRFEVVGKPVLRCHRACGAGRRVMLVVVHQHHAVNLGSDRGVVVFLVARLHADVQLHSLRMQITREFLEQGQIAWLCVPS